MEAKKQAPSQKGAKIERLVELLSIFEERSIIGITEIKETLGVSSRTVARYFVDFRAAGVDFHYNPQAASYELKQDTADEQMVFPNNQICRLNRLYRIEKYHWKHGPVPLSWYKETFGLSKRTRARDMRLLRLDYFPTSYIDLSEPYYN